VNWYENLTRKRSFFHITSGFDSTINWIRWVNAGSMSGKLMACGNCDFYISSFTGQPIIVENGGPFVVTPRRSLGYLESVITGQEMSVSSLGSSLFVTHLYKALFVINAVCGNRPGNEILPNRLLSRANACIDDSPKQMAKA